MVKDLKAKLQRAKEAAQVAKEATKVAEEAAYERGVAETETRLAEEVAVVCRDYCAKTYSEALNRAGVPADSKLQRVENIYFPEDIRENLIALPPPTILPLPSPKQPSTVQDPLWVLKS